METSVRKAWIVSVLMGTALAVIHWLTVDRWAYVEASGARKIQMPEWWVVGESMAVGIVMALVTGTVLSRGRSVKTLVFLLAAVAMGAALYCGSLVVRASDGIFGAFAGRPYDVKVHAKLLAEGGGGLVLSAGIVGVLVTLILLSKRIPWFLTPIGLLGVIQSVISAGHHSHDFSHVVFKECSDIYGIRFAIGVWILGACIVGIWAIDFWVRRRRKTVPSE